MATPIDPQDVEIEGGHHIDANPIDGIGSPPHRVVTTSRRIQVRGVYVLNSPSSEDEREDRHRASRRAPARRQPQPSRREARQAVVLYQRKEHIAALIVAVITFAIMNEETKQKCSKVSCTLNCGDGIEADCWVVIGGGAVLCTVTTVYILSLMIRTCTGSKLYCCCVLIELLFLLILLAGTALVGVFLSLGVEANPQCTNTTLDGCEDQVNKPELLDFMRQSEISAWISAGGVLFTVLLWILLVLSFLPKATRTVTETTPLLGN